MTSDRGLDATRAVRAKISREHGNDPRRLVEYYIRYQGRFANRLRPAPAPDQGPGKAAEQGAASDGTSR